MGLAQLTQQRGHQSRIERKVLVVVCSVTRRPIWVAKWGSFVAGHVSCGDRNVTSYAFVTSYCASVVEFVSACS